MDNGCIFNPSEQMDSQDSIEEDSSVDYFILLDIEWETCEWKMICKKTHTNINGWWWWVINSNYKIVLLLLLILIYFYLAHSVVVNGSSQYY